MISSYQRSEDLGIAYSRICNLFLQGLPDDFLGMSVEEAQSRYDYVNVDLTMEDMMRRAVVLDHYLHEDGEPPLHVAHQESGFDENNVPDVETVVPSEIEAWRAEAAEVYSEL